MADYHQIKNAAILTPTGSTDLGSDSNRYSNVFMSGNIVMNNGVTVTSTNAVSPRITSITYPGSVTAVLPAGGETVTITGTNFNNAGGVPTVIIGTTVASVVSYISSTSITFTTPALSAGTYLLTILHFDGAAAIFASGISYSGTPTWTTSAGSIGSIGTGATGISLSVAATGDAPITYSVKAGSSLPAGLSLNSSTGAITGTSPVIANETTYNFTLTATDLQNQTTDRAFSILVNVDLTSLNYLMVAGGGPGSASPNIAGAGGGAGGLITGALSITKGTTYTITVGAGGSSPNTNGSNTIMSGSGMSTLTAIGGGYGGFYDPGIGYRSGANGGSGGGAAWNGADMVTYGNALQSSSASGGFGFRGGTAGAQYSTGGGGGGAAGQGIDNTISNAGGVGGPGKLITITAAFVGTATTNSTTTLNITGVTTGEIQVGTQVTGTGIPAGSYITALGTGTGGTGTYIMNEAATSSGSGVAISSSGRYFAGGGGGVLNSTNVAYIGYGGRGGGGNGGADGSSAIVSSVLGPIAGATNTGGGGGGRGYQQSGGSTLGGSGVVLVSYPDSYPVAASTTGSPTLLTSGGLRVYKFTASGTITF
jgi:hypothetical protein